MIIPKTPVNFLEAKSGKSNILAHLEGGFICGTSHDVG
jgi:hypothetical protein